MTASRCAAALGLLASVACLGIAIGQPANPRGFGGGLKKSTTERKFGGTPVVPQTEPIAQRSAIPLAEPLGPTVQLRVYLLEVTRSEKDESPDHAGLVGAASDLPAKLRELRRRGMLVTARRINLAAADGHTAVATLGENRAFTTGVGVTQGGLSQRSISYREVGTTVQATPLVGPDGVVSLRLQVTDSRPAAGLPSPGGDGGPAAAEFTNLRIESSLRVRAGEAAVVQETTTQTVTGQAESIILVTATVEDTTPKK